MPISPRERRTAARRHDAALVQALVIAALAVGLANILSALGRI